MCSRQLVEQQLLIDSVDRRAEPGSAVQIKTCYRVHSSI